MCAIDFITRDKGEIVGEGGNDFQLVEVDDSLAELTTPDTFHDLGELLTSQLDPTSVPAEGYVLENKEARQVHGTEMVVLTIQCAQDINVEKLIREVKHKFYAFYWNKGTYSQKRREVVGFGQVFVTAGGNQRPGVGGGPTIEFRMIKAPATRIFDTAGTGANIALPTSATATIITLNLGEYYAELDT